MAFVCECVRASLYLAIQLPIFPYFYHNDININDPKNARTFPLDNFFSLDFSLFVWFKTLQYLIFIHFHFENLPSMPSYGKLRKNILRWTRFKLFVSSFVPLWIVSLEKVFRLIFVDGNGIQYFLLMQKIDRLRVRARDAWAGLVAIQKLHTWNTEYWTGQMKNHFFSLFSFQNINLNASIRNAAFKFKKLFALCINICIYIFFLFVSMNIYKSYAKSVNGFDVIYVDQSMWAWAHHIHIRSTSKNERERERIKK